MTRPPPQLRWMIRNAVSPFSCQHLLARYWSNRREGRRHSAALADCAWRIGEIDRRNTLKDYGPSHPEAQPDMQEAFA